MPHTSEPVNLQRSPAPKISHLLVGLQFILSTILVIIAPFQQLTIWHYVGILIGTLGLIWSVRAVRLSKLSIYPEVGSETILVAHGPYRWLRHPMYSSVLLATFFMIPYPPEWLPVVLWIGLLLVLDIKARREERLLLAAIPEYELFQRSRWRLIPLLY